MSLAGNVSARDSVSSVKSVVLSGSLVLSQAIIRGLGLRRASPMLIRNGMIELREGGRPERPDLAILHENDYVAAGALIDSLKRLWPGVRVLVVGVPNREDDILHCMAAGAAGLVTREESLDDLSKAAREVLGNAPRLPPRALSPLLDRLVALTSGQTRGRAPVLSRLSRRELEVLSCIARGAATKEIAVDLGIEVQTVKNHLGRMFRKLGVHSRHDAGRLWGGAGACRQ